MKPKLDRKRHANICSQLNWEIQQEERRIREHCSFFAFVGPASAFRRPRQITESIKTEAVGTIRFPQSAALKLKRRNIPTRSRAFYLP